MREMHAARAIIGVAESVREESDGLKAAAGTRGYEEIHVDLSGMPMPDVDVWKFRNFVTQ